MPRCRAAACRALHNEGKGPVSCPLSMIIRKKFGTLENITYLCTIDTLHNSHKECVSILKLTNKKMKTILFFLLTLCLGFPVIGEAQVLVLHHTNGKTTDIELSTQPQITFHNDKVLITSGVLNMEFPEEDVLTFTFRGGSLGINNPKVNVDYSKEDGQIVFHGIKPSENIAVYNMKGIRIPVKIQRSCDSATLLLSSIPSGVYLFNVNGKTSKFTKQ